MGWNGGCAAGGAALALIREADVDNSAFSSRGNDSTSLPPKVHTQRDRVARAAIEPG